jgi:hypothetical protein
MLAIGLTVVTLVTALSGLWEYQYELAHQASPASAQLVSANFKKTAHNSSYSSDGSGQTVPATDFGNGRQSPTLALVSPKPASSRQVASSNDNQTTSTTSPASPAVTSQPPNSVVPQLATVSLTLSINGQSKGLVKLVAGSNQCAVLTQALNDGLISSLDMRYSSQYNTEAVYVIDGIGDPGSIWWTYKVNGTAPPYGCAYVTVHDGDSVNWQYVKN